MNSIRKHLLINIAIELGGFPNRMGQIQQTLDFRTYTKWKNLFGL
tara:strand:- start:3597 stop:3731 length:135 start_codon:yes stop_codon:yes gene_type:complete